MIFFDIDGTLIDHASASAAASLVLYDQFPGEIPFGHEHFPAAWEAILNKHFTRFCQGEISIWEQRRERMREVFARPDFTDAEADSRYQVFIRAYQSLTCAFEDAAPCLEQLGDQPLGIISNGAREQQIGKLERAGLRRYFTVMVFSEDVGFGKPDSRIFLEACRRAGEAPSHCVHVGDDVVADIHASHALGIRPVWVDRLGVNQEQLPGRRVTSLHELVRALQPDSGGVEGWEKARKSRKQEPQDEMNP
jgi:putative hydrolase of the HAD superfamily